MAASILAFVFGCLLLALAARYVALVVMVGKERFRPGHPLGFRGRALLRSEEAWHVGHLAARPLAGMAAACAGVNAFATVGLTSLSIVAVTVVGLLAIACVTALGALARSLALKAAKKIN
ncbi:MAG: hypothetical protein Q4B10_01950 [Actinomycetaceae bacterium]|nr:hypothetical protein [Actinomycetaceae bacterium]